VSRARAAWLLWIAAVLLVPLPYFVIADGSVPAVRFALMTAIAAAYATLIDGSGVAWPLVTILALHLVVSAAVLAAGATVVAAVIPERVRGRVVVALVVAGFAVALSVDAYRTPFDDVHATASWLGLFQ